MGSNHFLSLFKTSEVSEYCYGRKERQVLWKLSSCSPSLTTNKKHGQLASMKQSPCFVSPLCSCQTVWPVHRAAQTHAGQWTRIGFACMYDSLPDISPEASGILIASHLPYVCSICLSLHPSLPPPSHSSTANEAEAALDPTTEPFKVARQGFLAM